MNSVFVHVQVRNGTRERSQNARFNFRESGARNPNGRQNGYGKPFGRQNGYWKKSRHTSAVDEEDLRKEEEEEELGGSGTVINSTNSTEETDEELGRLKNFRISKHTRHLLKGMYVG